MKVMIASMINVITSATPSRSPKFDGLSPILKSARGIPPPRLWTACPPWRRRLDFELWTLDTFMTTDCMLKDQRCEPLRVGGTTAHCPHGSPETWLQR